jgi:hypothetical protein
MATNQRAKHLLLPDDTANLRSLPIQKKNLASSVNVLENVQQ